MVRRTKIKDSIGWCGVILILIAYFLVSFGFIMADGFAYPTLNLLGSLCIIIETLSKKDYQPAILNIIWLLIAFIAIARALI